MSKDDLPRVLILCGGRGTRLRTGAASLPKPLVEIGGMPVVWHVVRLYAAQGFSRFTLLTGHRGDEVKNFAASAQWPSGVEVDCLNTGEDTPTGGRVHQAVQAMGPQTMCVTYADGVSNVDLLAVLKELKESAAEAIVTVVRPELPFGVARLEGDHIVGFEEKPKSDEWVNGGFMVFTAEGADQIGPSDVLERGPLETLAGSGKLLAHKHDGFWFCMDTYKDQVALNDLWEDGSAPWRNWN